jgi:hypothetical protein
MKKAIIFAAAAAMILTGTVGANAQTKGKFWVGGNISFESTELSSVASSNSLTILPEFGYNFSDRWAAGILFGMSQSKIEGTIGDNRLQGFSVTPFARYTFFNWKALSLFADGGLRYESVTGDAGFEYESPDGTYTSTANEVRHANLFVNPGFSVRLAKHFALVGSMNIFSAGYTETSLSSSYTGSADTNSWAASLNSPFNLDNFSLGFNVTF